MQTGRSVRQAGIGSLWTGFRLLSEEEHNSQFGESQRPDQRVAQRNECKLGFSSADGFRSFNLRA